jgi:hypothetical protein
MALGLNAGTCDNPAQLSITTSVAELLVANIGAAANSKMRYPCCFNDQACSSSFFQDTVAQSGTDENDASVL